MLKNIKNTNRHIVCSIVLMLALAAVLSGCAAPNDVRKSPNSDDTGQSSQATESNSSPQNERSETDVQATDLVIPISNISETATFYPLEIEGTKLEVLAVKAPDGSIRTAFNTCQVCYASGRGYYEQEGNVLVCQNCRNRFSTDEVEVTRGGCNPVPITDEYKTATGESITIPYDFLNEARVIFSNWRTNYPSAG